MRDPFALSENKIPPVVVPDQGLKKPKSTKKFFLAGAIVLGLAIILGAVAVSAIKRNRASADVATENFIAKIEFDNFPETLKSGEDFLATLSITNKGQSDIKDSYVLVRTTGLNLKSTIDLSTLAEDEPGYLRELKQEENKLFGETSGGGFYWYAGDLGTKQTKSQQVKGKVISGKGEDVKIEAKYYSLLEEKTDCSALGLGKCQIKKTPIQIAYEAYSLSLEENVKIKIRAGYNFITLPYVFTSVSAKNFLSSLKDRWAYYFSPANSGYVSLYQDENIPLIKPGVGFWIYSNNGEEIALPETRVETNPNDSYSIDLSIGWNHLGNPFTKRLIVSGDKILVREITEDGSASGAVYSLKTAIENNVLSLPYQLTSKSFIDSNQIQNDLTKILEWKVLNLGSTLEPFIGIIIKSEKKVALVIPGKEAIAPGDLLSDSEKNKIISWISQNGLNEFGDPAGTAYSGGVPLDSNSNPINRFDYIVIKHPDRPWDK